MASNPLPGLLLASLLAPPAWAAPWSMEGHDPQRRHASDVIGPAEVDRLVVAELPEELVVNMPLVEGEGGRVLVGTWGVIRDLGADAQADWDKLDGELFAFDGGELTPAWSTDLPRVPWCYAYDGADAKGCPEGQTLNYYNGTVEGTPVVRDGVAYVGRGDGAVYAIDLATGATLWTFHTFNPEDPSDPEGGGEVIGGILADDAGTLYFATVGIGPAETNAVYAVSADGALRWRYPSADASLDTCFWGALALSADGQTVYAPGGWGPKGDELDHDVHGRVYAFDRDGGLRWAHEAQNTAAWWQPWVWPLKLTVGSDGTIFVGAVEWTAGLNSPLVYALRDEGDAATFTWPAMVDVDPGGASEIGNLALREGPDGPEALYVPSAYNPGLSFPEGGLLAVLDPADGAAAWTWDPAENGAHGGVSGVALDGNGDAYVAVAGVRGTPGLLLSLDPEGAERWRVELEGNVGWGRPMLGDDGGVYLADWDDDCAAARIWPVEDAGCGEGTLTPRVYALGGEPAAARPEDPPGCGCRTGGEGARWGALLVALGLLWRRLGRG